MGEPYCHNNRSFEIEVYRNLDMHCVLADIIESIIARQLL